MQTQADTAIPPRPVYPHSSRTIVAADARTRELAEAMVRLNAEGEATETALLREGFSAHELKHLSDAARAIANNIFVRSIDRPQPTDEDLLASAIGAVAPPNPDRLARRLYGAGFTHDQLARIWPKLCARLAKQTALLPIPNAPVVS